MRSHLIALLFFAQTQLLFAQPATPEYLEGLARQARIQELTPLLADKAMAAQVLARLQKPSANYLQEVDRQVALNVLARLLPDPALERSLKQAGQWVEDERWHSQQPQAALDLPRTLRFRKELALTDWLTGLGAYSEAMEHLKMAQAEAPFQERSQAFLQAGRRRTALQLLMDVQGVGEGHIALLDQLLALELPEEASAQENLLSMNLEMVRSADRAGLPMSSRRAYQQLDKLTAASRLDCKPMLRFILGTQLFHLDWESDSAVSQRARGEFERLAAELKPVEKLDPYWGARLAQSLVLWPEMGAGPWFEKQVGEWAQRYHLKVFDYVAWRARLVRVAALRRSGRAAEANQELRRLESDLAQMTREVPDWRTLKGNTVPVQEAEWVLQDLHLEKARALRARPEGLFPALLEYRQALGFANRPRDVADLLNECAPLVRQFESQSFEAENRQALETSRKMGHRPGLVMAQAQLGLYQVERGQAAEATKNLSAAIELFEKYLVDLRPSEARRAALKDSLKEVYQTYAELRLQQGDSEGAFQTLARHQQIQQTLSAPVLRSQDSNLQNQLENAQLAREKAVVHEAGGSAELLARTKAEFFSIVRELRSAGKNYGGMLAVQPVEFAQLQQQLPADTLLVQYYPTAQTLYFFVVSRKGFKVRSLAIGKTELFRKVHDFRRLCREQGIQATQNKNWDWSGEPGQALCQVLSQLNKALIQPIRDDLNGYRVLAVVPTENLLYLPYPALAEVRGGKPHYLVEDVAVVTLLRATDLARLDRPAGTQGTLLALGNPDGTLAGAQKEVEELGRTFPQAEVAVRQQATAARLSKTSKPPQLIHLATHAFLDQNQPNKSYLVVAGEGANGRLTVPQIFDLPLQKTRLVTLSACETDLGESEPGAAVSSLAEAFWVAGSPSLLASLWAVEDNSTGALMVNFYRRLREGSPVGESLRQAQLGLIKDSRTNHPFFWAPFVLIGNWQ